MQLSRSTSRVLGVALCAFAFTATALAEDEPTHLKFSAPAKPGTLKFSVPWADVKIVGGDGPDVVIHSSLEKKRGADEVDDEGFRRLDEGSSFEATESGNVISVSSPSGPHAINHDAEFRIEVPRGTHLIVRTQFGGDIQIANIDGDVDVNCMNGEVDLEDLSSSAVVNTMNGEVRVRFRTAPVKPISITSMNGEIDLQLPADTKANVRLRTHNGNVRTNFPSGTLVTKTERTNVRSYGIAPRATESITSQAREIAREAEKLAREQAQVARDVAREQARAAREIARATTGEAGEPAAPEAPEAPEAPMAPTPAGSFVGGKSIVGTLNGGGIDIALSSMNGTITLRKAK